MDPEDCLFINAAVCGIVGTAFCVSDEDWEDDEGFCT